MTNILKETAQGIIVVPLDTALFSERKVFFTEEVNTDTMNSLIKQLMFLEIYARGEEITLYIKEALIKAAGIVSDP